MTSLFVGLGIDLDSFAGYLIAGRESVCSVVGDGAGGVEGEAGEAV